MMAQGSSVFNALVLLFADPPEGFDPDLLVTALRRVDADGFQNVIRNVQGSEERSVALRNAIVAALDDGGPIAAAACDSCRSEEHPSELQSLMRISYAVLSLEKQTE